MKAIAKRLRRLEDQFGPGDVKPRERFRIVVRHLGPDPGLEKATCRRTLWPNGTVCEIVHFGTTHPERDLPEDKLDEWVASFPVETL